MKQEQKQSTSVVGVKDNCPKTVFSNDGEKYQHMKLIKTTIRNFVLSLFSFQKGKEIMSNSFTKIYHINNMHNIINSLDRQEFKILEIHHLLGGFHYNVPNHLLEIMQMKFKDFTMDDTPCSLDCYK